MSTSKHAPGSVPRQASRLPLFSSRPFGPRVGSGPFILLLALLFASTARAHPFLQDSWWVVVETNRLVMRVSATLREVAVVQQVNLATNGITDLARLQAALTNHGDYVLKALRLEADGGPLAGEVLDWHLVGDLGAAEPADSPLYLDRTHAAFDLEFRFAGDRPPAEIIFAHATLKEHRYAPGVPWDVTYALTVKDAARKDLAAGIVRMDLPFSLMLPGATNATSPGAPSIAQQDREAALVPSDARRSGPVADPLADFRPASPGASFTAYLRLGVHHILTGYDHLLFLGALALAALKLSDFFKLIATFTVAHSLTVTLSALGLVRLPPGFVEPFIAASIVFVAVENLVAPKRAGARSRLLLAFGFGLVHGLGFAGGLNDALGTHAGLGSAALAWAILAFCLGVEAGHLLVGLPFWSVLRAARAEFGEAFGPRALRVGSVAVALGGAYFLVAALRQYL